MLLFPSTRTGTAAICLENTEIVKEHISQGAYYLLWFWFSNNRMQMFEHVPVLTKKKEFYRNDHSNLFL